MDELQALFQSPAQEQGKRASETGYNAWLPQEFILSRSPAVQCTRKTMPTQPQPRSRRAQALPDTGVHPQCAPGRAREAGKADARFCLAMGEARLVVAGAGADGPPAFLPPARRGRGARGWGGA